MPQLLLYAKMFSIGGFLFYGLSCIFHPELKKEFVRYGVPQFRVLVGCLEVAGALGILVGFWLPFLTPLAAGGLTLLMTCGVGVRMKIKDSLLQASPALFFGVLNGYITVASLTG